MDAHPFPIQDAIHVLQTSLNIEPLHRQTLTRLLSSEEKERANDFHFDADRRRYIAARGTLRLLLGAYLDRSPASLEFTCGASGKPSLKGLSDTASLYFNLSHTADLAVYAITRIASVGIDAERVHSNLEVDEIAAAFLAQEEAASLTKLSADRRNARFYQIWARKEAYCKARGQGLTRDLHEINVSTPEETVPRWFPIRVGGVSARDVHLRDLNVGADYAAAIAIESDITPRIVHLDIRIVSASNPHTLNFLYHAMDNAIQTRQESIVSIDNFEGEDQNEISGV